MPLQLRDVSHNKILTYRPYEIYSMDETTTMDQRS